MKKIGGEFKNYSRFKLRKTEFLRRKRLNSFSERKLK
jgi:hypothetical protein